MQSLSEPAAGAWNARVDHLENKNKLGFLPLVTDSRLVIICATRLAPSSATRVVKKGGE
jgi:hypothetical protein